MSISNVALERMCKSLCVFALMVVAILNLGIAVAIAGDDETRDCDDTYWTKTEDCTDDPSCDVATATCYATRFEYLKGTKCGCL